MTEMHCNVTAWPVCQLEMLSKPEQRVRPFPTEFIQKRCEERQETVKHTKATQQSNKIVFLSDHC